jgi:hypothetical protein
MGPKWATQSPKEPGNWWPGSHGKSQLPEDIHVTAIEGEGEGILFSYKKKGQIQNNVRWTIAKEA